MKNYILTILFITVFTSCSLQKNRPEERCNKILKNNYSSILQEPYQPKLNINYTVNEVKYKCTHSPLLIKKGLYDRFGMWHKTIYNSNNKHPVLLWENIQLFNKDTTKFTVAASGFENRYGTFTSVMVFDANGSDILAENTPQKEQLILYFSDLIKNNDSNNKIFFTTYWDNLEYYNYNEFKPVKTN